MRKSADDHKKALIDELSAARQSLLETIQEIPKDRAREACIGSWSANELAAHLIGWDYTNIQAVKEILDGQRPKFFQHYDPDWQSYNARLVETYRAETLDETARKAVHSHLELVTFLQALPAEEVMLKTSPKEQGRTISIRNLLRAEAEDERKHCTQVRAFLEKIKAVKSAE